MRMISSAALAASFLIGGTTMAAMAHVSLQQAEAAPGTYKAMLGVPHGCDGEATLSIRVEIPEGFIDARPVPKPGWSIRIEEGAYARSYPLHGEEVSSGPLAVTWEGGSLADAHYDEFVLRGTLAGVEDGQRLFFKTVQSCANGAAAWTEIPAAGQDPHALAHPAPSVLIASRSEHGDHAHHETGTPVRIVEPWARAMLPGQPTGGAYMTLRNNGESDERLVSVSSPAAGRVEIHSMEIENNVMVMRPVEDGLAIAAGESVALEPGGLHLMFFEVREPFREGGQVPVTLHFEKTGEMEVVLPVRAAAAGRGGHAHQH